MRPYAAQWLKKSAPAGTAQSGAGQRAVRPWEGDSMSADEWARIAVRALIRRLLTQLAVQHEAAAKELRGRLK